MASRDSIQDLEKGFWRIVLLLNIGPIALTIGVMTAFLADKPAASVLALIIGGVALLRAAQLYERYAP